LDRWVAYGAPLRRHRVITHLTVAAAALAVTVGVAIPTAPSIKAGLQPAPRQESILPANIGIGVRSDEPVTLTFPAPMDRDAVAAALGLAPSTAVSLMWSLDSRSVALLPAPRWASDERYVIHVPSGTATAEGTTLAADWRASFTTQTAPHVVRLRVDGVVEPATALPAERQEVMASTGAPDSGMSAISDDLETDASAGTRIGVTFSTAMRGPETEAAFRLSPELAGTFAWEGTTLWFTPEARLQPGTRYTVTIAGARDVDGSPVGGDASFSFTTRADAQAMTVSPSIDATGVAGGASVQVSFSQPMATGVTGSAFTLTDVASGRPVVGTVAWSPDAKTLTFDPTAALAAGRTFTAAIGAAARDADGNPVTISWRFRTAGGVTRSAGPVATAIPAGGSAVEYALNQVNAARASYGRAPLVLDATISAVAYAHAADMLAYNYFSHTSRNGMTFAQRLTAGGVSYGYRGENICFLGGASVTTALNWCHAQFMAEPYPGGGNHKDNILSPNFRRIGIGIATGGGKVYVVWDFTD
jgi:hypothetical protein